MKNVIFIAVAIFTFFVSQQTEAQNRWSLEFESGAAFSTKDMGDANLGTGFGFEGTVSYRFMQHLAAYAGWGWNQFSANHSFAGSDIDFEETGYTFGFQFIHPIGETSLSYLVKAGGIYNHIEVENLDGEIISDSGHGLGWTAEVGLSIPLYDQLRLQPSVGYRSLSRDIEIANENTTVDLNYVSVGVGLSWVF